MSDKRKMTNNTGRRNGLRPSRRAFLGGVAAATAAEAIFKPKTLFGDTAIPSIKIPLAFSEALGAAATRAGFDEQGITGSQVFANLCKDEDLVAMFCCPGNYNMINDIAQVGIPCYGGRTEGGMCSAADGFTRATGEAVVCSGATGPGLTHMIMNIATAHSANSPILVIAGSPGNRSDEASTMQQPTTEGLRKYGKLIPTPNRVYEYGAYAFRNVKSAVPDVVHLDFPNEVLGERFQDPSKLDCYWGKEKYRTESRAYPGSKEMQQAIEMINKAERPLLVAGHGVFIRKAWDALMQAAEKHEMAVLASGPTRGHFPDEHHLSGSLSSEALMSADLVVFVGQYQMPTGRRYALPPGVKTIRIHPEQGDLGRNWPLDLGIVSDERVFMEALANGLPPKRRETWINEIAAARQKWEKAQIAQYDQALKYSRDANLLHPFALAREVHEFFYRGNVDPKQTVVAYGGHFTGMCIMRWLRAYRPGQVIPAIYGYGPMGPDLAMGMGAAVAVQRGIGPQASYKGAPVVVVTGDSSMGYTLMELDTCTKYKLPVICIVHNNGAWGTFTNIRPATPRALHMYLFQENLRYDKIAESLGARGEHVRTPEELRAALKRSYDAAAKENASTLINCQSLRDFSIATLYPPGQFGNLPQPSAGGNGP